MPNIDLMALKAETKVLKVTFQQLEAMPVNQARSLDINKILSDLLTCAYTLALRDDLVTSIDAIPNCGKFGPETSSVLRTALGKLGRYYSASHFLIFAARKLAIFKNIRVEGVSLPTSAAFPLSEPLPQGFISNILRRIKRPTTPENMSQLTWTLEEKSGVSLASAEAKFRECLVSSRHQCKVHAEIQLIHHYELHPKTMHP